MDFFKNITYFIDEGSNLNAMTIALKSIMKCEIVSLDSKVFVLSMFFLKLVNMLQLMKSFAKTLMCFHQVCLVIFTNV
jgi:hypothetical protein